MVVIHSYDMSTRINARIDDDLGKLLERHCRRTGQSLTAVIVRALRAFVEQEERSASAAEVFAAHGFVGSGKGPEDLARNSKRYLAASLGKKT